MTLREFLNMNTNMSISFDLNVYTGEMICGVRMNEVDEKYLDLTVTSFYVYPDEITHNGEFTVCHNTIEVVLDRPEMCTMPDLIERDEAYAEIGFERCGRSCKDCPTTCTWFYTVRNIPAYKNKTASTCSDCVRK